MRGELEDVRHAFLRYNAALMTLSAHMARDLGLTVSEMAACDHLHMDGPLTPGELGVRLGLSSGAVTALVDRLAERGYVERRPNPADRRSVQIYLLPQPPRRVGRLNAVMERAAREMSTLDAAESAALARVMNALADAVAEATRGS
jgi:DNA-binding MarR family transcriptional regulator